MLVVHRWVVALLCAVDLLHLSRALQLLPPKNGTAAFPEARPNKLGTPGPIVFDRLGWKPTCKDLLQYAADNPALNISAGIRKVGLHACNERAGHPSFSVDTGAVSPRATGKPIDFVHVSKAAGTFFCDCGNANGRNRGLAHDGLVNCHYLDEDAVYWESQGPAPSWASRLPRKSSCLSLASQMRSRGIDLEGNENFLPGEGDLCPEFENIMIIREPIHRLVSHLLFMEFDPMNMTLEEILVQFPRLSNNYYARVLGGEAVQGLPRGQLPPWLLERARRKLHEFDDVFVMDEHLKSRVEGRFGWNCTGAGGRRSADAGGTTGRVAELRRRWPPGAWDALLAANAVDTELFKEAQVMNAAQSLLRQVGISEDSA